MVQTVATPRAYPGTYPEPQQGEGGEAEEIGAEQEDECECRVYGHVDLNSPSVQQLKRIFKAAALDDATGGRRNLHLENAPPRKRSEVQAYMALYYDTRIRSTVVKRWADAGIPNMDFSGGLEEIPEDQIDPDDSSLMKDIKIPLCFKNLVAQELFDKEEEEIKAAVRSKRDADVVIKTVYNTDEEARSELVREYQK